MIHWLAHLFGWNQGNPASFWHDGNLMMSFVCSGCGKRTGVHIVDPEIYGG